MKKIVSYATASKSNALLSAVLGLQLVVAGALYWQSSGQGEFSKAQSIAGFDLDAADTLIIEDSEATLTLARTDEKWQVNGEPAIPVDAGAVVGVLESLADLEAGLPVATSEASQAQLEVADDNYQRRLTVKQGENELAQMYLGTSPGFRKAHVRLAGEDAVHAASINVFDFQTSESDWLDKQYFAFNDVTGVAGDGFTVRRENSTWHIEEPENRRESHVVDVAVADEMINSLEQLALTGIYEPSEASTSDDTEAEVSEVRLTVQVDGKPVVLAMVKQDDIVYVERDDLDGRFTLSTAVFEKFSDYTIESLLLEEGDASVN